MIYLVLAGIRIGYKEVFKTVGHFIASSTVHMIKAAIMAIVWWNIAELAGYSLTYKVQLSLFVFFAMSNPITELKSRFQNDIASGDFSQAYSLPGSFFLRYFGGMFGRWVSFFVFSLLWTIPVFIYWSGSLCLNVDRFLLASGLLFVGVVILGCERLLIEGLAFWIPDSFSLNQLHNTVRVLLSGALFPFANSTNYNLNPYALGISTPAKILSNPNFVLASSSLLLLLVYLMVLLSLLWVQSRLIRQQVVIYGG